MRIKLFPVNPHCIYTVRGKTSPARGAFVVGKLNIQEYPVSHISIAKLALGGEEIAAALINFFLRCTPRTITKRDADSDDRDVARG